MNTFIALLLLVRRDKAQTVRKRRIRDSRKYGNKYGRKYSSIRDYQKKYGKCVSGSPRASGEKLLQASDSLNVAEDDATSNHPSDGRISITPPRLTPAIIKAQHCFNSAPFGDQ